jgi:hypothetical protein
VKQKTLPPKKSLKKKIKSEATQEELVEEDD